MVQATCVCTLIKRGDKHYLTFIPENADVEENPFLIPLQDKKGELAKSIKKSFKKSQSK